MTGEPAVRNAVPSDAAGLAALWARAFTPPLAPDQWETDPERFAHTIVAVDEAGLVGSIYGLPKRLREDEGGTAQVHAIGSVAVADRARGRGVARRLVAATLDAARRSGADWALLFTGTPLVYRSSGFEAFAMRRTLAGPWSADDPSGTRTSWEVRREGIGPGTTASWARAYDDSREGLVLAPVRSSLDWTMAEVRLAGKRGYVVERDGGVLGYAVAEARAGRGELAELAVPGSAPDGVREALLAAIADDWRSAAVEGCDLAVPDRVADTAAVRAFAPRARRVRDDTGMTRPLGRDPRLTGIRHFDAADYF